MKCVIDSECFDWFQDRFPTLSFFFFIFFVSFNDSSINGVRLIFTLGLICYFHFNKKKQNKKIVTFKIIGINLGYS